MKRVRHVLGALSACLRVAMMTALQYRASFIAQAAVSIFWLAWTTVPLFVVYGQGGAVAGWSRDEALVVVGFFITLSGLLDAFVDPNLSAVVQHVREGTLDFILLKPIDSQILVSVHRCEPAKLSHVIAGVIVAAVAAARLPGSPRLVDVITSGVLLLSGLCILHSLWTLVVSLSFKFVRVDNLSYLLRSIVDTGRWPSSFFPAAVRIVLTFVVPVGIMTTYPALALRGALGLRGVLTGIGVAAGFTVLARLGWTRAVRHYASASS